jgi:hypothetical protein
MLGNEHLKGARKRHVERLARQQGNVRREQEVVSSAAERGRRQASLELANVGPIDLSAKAKLLPGQ